MKTIRSLSIAIAPALAITCSAGEAGAMGGLTVIHSFENDKPDDGAVPYGGVAPAPHGGFYVASYIGGSSGEGTLTLIKKDGTSQILHSFAGGSDGAEPYATPYRWSVDGDIYGTTYYGGASNCGTIWRYVPRTGAYQQLWASGCYPDGAAPQDALVDVGGALEATASLAGKADAGALIFVRSDGSSGSGCYFPGPGTFPLASVTEANGNTYTTTSAGGLYNDGTITEFHGVTCNASVLHDFAGGSDGIYPTGSLLFYNNALYGTTKNGGATGLGTVFKINPDGSGYTILHTFQGICCGSDGSFPSAGLTLNPKDNMLYGTTVNGGNSSDNGTVFKIDPNTGAETVAYSFSGNDGANPGYGNLYIRKGTIYGTTSHGGAYNYGTVFKLKT